jgi:hypothetical protein
MKGFIRPKESGAVPACDRTRCFEIRHTNVRGALS